MDSGLIIVFTAASGTGKTTLARKLIEQDGMLKASVSYTTREKRSGEVDGECYHFVSSEQFSDMVDRGDFLERTSIYGNKYGTVKREVDKIISQGKDAVLVLDW
ncbi:MAG: guanylate kinase, partial [Pseudomonadota bacterium]|nr:guanylate kinase [Pseudomonadota bacterium]